ncbi:YciI family protein [Paenibacillus sp. CAA11]|uniref:YciI family protein n=1 Tax=Paenibacillus sp. CAA11 TaxID=1532905 RepID=UPI001F2592B5|nr:YciI family protein [Paenibacillus sp. CAA11]
MYLLITKRTDQFNASFIQPHYDYLSKLEEEGVLIDFGPFGDGSGGAYLIKCTSWEEALETANADPLSKAAPQQWKLRSGS